jgi:phospho-N-acetylmuramoyl-pentapeptide-transferase
MLYHLFDWLADHWAPAELLHSITFRSLMAALTSLGVGIGAVGWLIHWLGKRRIEEDVTLKDSEELARMHSPKASTPTMGGLGIAGALAGAVLLWAPLDNPYILLGLFTVASLAALGFWDDYVKLRVKDRKGLGIREKLLYQTAFMLAVSASLFLLHQEGGSVRTFLPLIKTGPALPAFVFIPFVTFVLVATLNSVNFTDGLDGLAAGCTAIAAVPLFLLVYAAGRVDYATYLAIPHVEGAGELAVFAAALLGASVGFLWYNCHPAQIFMGDTGSLPLGGAVGFLACSVKQEFLLLVLGGVFAAEGLSVVLQVLSFRIFGRRLFLIAPLHHRYQFKGWPESRITIRLWIAASGCAAASVALLRI